jgi:hypothetical protein
MFLCDECNEPYQSNGDCSGICEDCRDERELRRMLDAMSEDEYVAFMHERSAKQSNMLFRTLLNLKVA